MDAGKVENKITPYLYGACMEDVNHEIYGGLYDQKIFGESFEEPVSMDNFIGSVSYTHLDVYKRQTYIEQVHIIVSYSGSV